MFFLHKWKKNLESDIDCMEESMQPYIALFYAFRKIRHDFANYVQTLQLFAEVENYDEKKFLMRGLSFKDIEIMDSNGELIKQNSYVAIMDSVLDIFSKFVMGGKS